MLSTRVLPYLGRVLKQESKRSKRRKLTDIEMERSPMPGGASAEPPLIGLKPHRRASADGSVAKYEGLIGWNIARSSFHMRFSVAT